MATSLEKRLKAAVDALASGGSPKPVNVIRNSGDTPTPTPPVPPVPEPEKGTFMGAVTGEVGKISATRGKGGDPYPVELTIYNSSQEEIASGSFTAEDVAPLEVVDEDIVAGTYSVHIVWLGSKQVEGEWVDAWLYDDKEVTVAAAE
jgi:hypothetical protein